MFRLEGKLGRALTEVAQAHERACFAEVEVAGLKEKLTEQERAAEAEKEHLCNLKNKMAREKRDAQSDWPHRLSNCNPSSLPTEND